MGNNLNVDSKVSHIDDIISFSLENLNQTEIEKVKDKYQNLKVWRFFEKGDNKIESEAVILPHLWKNQFLLNSLEAYIILLIDKGTHDYSEISSFPLNLWGIIESSTNMTPRGLKYAFSSSNDKSENLESFMLSKRNFLNSDFKYVLFIWNGKNCSSQIKSTILMKAFDLDKKISDPSILPYLYNGFFISKINNSLIMHKGSLVKLNDIVTNSIDHIYDDVLPTPSSETIYNYQETVYLLHWLYPNVEKKNEKKPTNRMCKRILFGKFNQNFLNVPEKKSFYDCFTIIKDRDTNYKFSDEKVIFINNNKSWTQDNLTVNCIDLEKSKIIEKKNEEKINKEDLMDLDDQSLIEEENFENVQDMDQIHCEEEENEDDYNEDDLLDEINFTDAIPFNNNKLEVKKLNIEEIYKNKEKNYMDIEKVKNEKKQEILIPKISMKLQHKISNPTDRSRQLIEEEEKLDSLGTTIIKNASDIIKGKMLLSDKTLNLNLNLKYNKNEIKNPQIGTEFDENMENESFRKDLLMDYFSKNISEIIDGFLFLSSYNVAKNRELIFKHKITHIINSASDVCQNHFEREIQYLNFNLKDHSMEVIILINLYKNIECLFYETIQYIESVRESGGRVLVHCIQGISRSVTLVLSYLIYKNKINYDEAFRIVHSQRSIASPNLGFSIQLQIFYQRLFEPPENFRYYPKIFSVGSFQLEQPEKIVCKLVK